MNKEAIEVQRNEIEEEIIKLGYESLRYSILETSTQNREEWQNRIDFESGKYFVYATMDRASVNKKREYASFQEASDRFFRLLDLTVESNRWRIKENEPAEYSSPLWDNCDSEN